MPVQSDRTPITVEVSGIVRSYRAEIRLTAEVTSVSTQIQAWDTTTDGWTWVPVQHWDLHTTARGDDLRTDLLDSLTRNGWRAHDIAGMDLRANPAVCTIEPTDWAGLLTGLAADRDAAAARLSDLDQALRSAAADATDTGDLTAVRAADLMGLTRVRAWQHRSAITASMKRALDAGASLDTDRLTAPERSALGLD